MNDRYLFRGKRVDAEKWVYGSYVPKLMLCLRDDGQHSEYPSIFALDIAADGGNEGWHMVESESIGQSTGLYDKTGRLIFEGDIIGNLKPHGTFNPTVQFRDGAFWLADFHLSDCAEKAVIIGNIHDNPELLEV